MTITIRQKRLPNNLLKNTTKKEARIASGYSESYALSGQIDKTEGGKKANKITLNLYKAELSRIQAAMAAKDLDKEQYQVLIIAADKIQKQIQLLSGGDTERVKIKGVDIFFRKYGENLPKV